MAHNQALQFIVIESNTCDSITVHEQILWDNINPPTHRDEIGLALFYRNISSGISGCDLSNPGNNTTNAEWVIPIESAGQYEIFMFAVHRWIDMGSVWPLYSIVYHNGFFWICMDPNIDREPGTNINIWRKATCDDFIMFNNYCMGASHNIKFLLNEFFSSIYNSECVSARVLNVGCNRYQVQDIAAPEIQEQPNFMLPTLVKVWNLAMTEEIIDCIYIDRMAGETLANVQLPDDDGVYVIEVGYGSYTNVIWDENTPPNMISYTIVRDCAFNADLPTNQYVAYGICNIESCWKKLYDKMMCKPVDVCCDSCDPEVKEEMENFRYTLNMMNALWFNLMAYIELEQGIYMHLYNLYTINGVVSDPVRMSFLQHIADIIEKIAEITERCGDCNGAFSNETGCTEC